MNPEADAVAISTRGNISSNGNEPKLTCVREDTGIPQPDPVRKGEFIASGRVVGTIGRG